MKRFDPPLSSAYADPSTSNALCTVWGLPRSATVYPHTCSVRLQIRLPFTQTCVQLHFLKPPWTTAHCSILLMLLWSSAYCYLRRLSFHPWPLLGAPVARPVQLLSFVFSWAVISSESSLRLSSSSKCTVIAYIRNYTKLTSSKKLTFFPWCQAVEFSLSLSDQWPENIQSNPLLFERGNWYQRQLGAQTAP